MSYKSCIHHLKKETVLQQNIPKTGIRINTRLKDETQMNVCSANICKFIYIYIFNIRIISGFCDFAPSVIRPDPRDIDWRLKSGGNNIYIYIKHVDSNRMPRRIYVYTGVCVQGLRYTQMQVTFCAVE